MNLAVSLETPDKIALLRSILGLPLFTEKKLHRITVDAREKKVTLDWFDKWVATCKQTIFLYWDENEEDFIIFDQDGMVKIIVSQFQGDAHTLLTLLSPLPWTLATFKTIHDTWRKSDNMYRSRGFGDLHFSHGWGCAFKGEGHQRLVSRRWLEFWTLVFPYWR